MSPNEIRDRTEPVAKGSRQRSERSGLSGKDLEDLKAGRYLRFHFSSEEEARYWLQQWREGKRRAHEAAQYGTSKKAEVRE